MPTKIAFSLFAILFTVGCAGGGILPFSKGESQYVHVEGRLIDKSTLMPIAGVTVYLTRYDTGSSNIFKRRKGRQQLAVATSNESGWFTLTTDKDASQLTIESSDNSFVEIRVGQTNDDVQFSPDHSIHELRVVRAPAELLMGNTATAAPTTAPAPEE